MNKDLNKKLRWRFVGCSVCSECKWRIVVRKKNEEFKENDQKVGKVSQSKKKGNKPTKWNLGFVDSVFLIDRERLRVREERKKGFRGLLSLVFPKT